MRLNDLTGNGKRGGKRFRQECVKNILFEFPVRDKCKNDRIFEQAVFCYYNNNKSINNAQFILAISNLRQWLNAFYKIYKKALWDTAIFPNWMKDKEQVLKTKILLN